MQGQQHSAQIFSLAVLLSSIFIYNQIGAIDAIAIERMAMVCSLAKRIRDKSQPGEDCLQRQQCIGCCVCAADVTEDVYRRAAWLCVSSGQQAATVALPCAKGIHPAGVVLQQLVCGKQEIRHTKQPRTGGQASPGGKLHGVACCACASITLHVLQAGLCSHI